MWLNISSLFIRYLCIKDGLFLLCTQNSAASISRCFIDLKSYVEWGALWQKLWFLSMPYFKLLVHDQGICQQVYNHQGRHCNKHYEIKSNEIKLWLHFYFTRDHTSLKCVTREIKSMYIKTSCVRIISRISITYYDYY